MTGEDNEKQRKWASFGRWMGLSSGMVLLFGAFYQGEGFISMILRTWMAMIGAYFIYAAIRALGTDCIPTRCSYKFADICGVATSWNRCCF